MNQEELRLHRCCFTEHRPDKMELVEKEIIAPEKAKELIMAYGTNRVLFGTDYPMWEPKAEIERFMMIDLSDDECEEYFIKCGKDI